ncbi:MAG TPA: LuxR C-terminal-related transcriptional regulator [Acidimicrobiales bacterium]|nr:LuxR C-terminal-related transcriptional regulator [Acidimicrobiales bacterium]
MGAVRQQTETRSEQAIADVARHRPPRLVSSKLRPPELPPGHVPRPALCGVLSRRDTRLTLLSGPPGAGKTTLLSEWVMANDDVRVAWLSVDGQDDDPIHFWTYLVASLQAHEPSIGVEALDLVRDADDDDSLTPVESLVADLADLERPTTLVLDDLHRVQRQHVFHALDYLIGNLPADLRVILSTRVDPPLALHRLRARGEIVELRQSDLVFREEDARTFFERFGKLRLRPADVEVLTERTEGWVAGLQLAALSLQGVQDPGAFVRRFDGPHPMVSDYLIGEVLDRQPAAIQSFLLETSVLSELDASLCDAVTRRTDSHRLLRRLEAGNLFVLPADTSGHSFRYHHLFAELLQAELRARDREAWRRTHRRAADWYSATGRPSDVMNHLLAGGFQDEALDFLIENAPRFYDTAQVAEMLRWLDRFPEGFFDDRPQRMLDLSFVLILGGRYAEATRCLEQVQRTLLSEKRPDRVQSTRLNGHWAMLSHLVGDAARAISCAERAIDSYDPDGDDGYVARFPDGIVRSWGWLEDTEQAWRAQQRVYPFPPVAESIGRFLTPATLSQIHLVEGHLQAAERLADEALMYVNPDGPDHPALIEARLTRAGVQLERDELDESERDFELALREAEAHSRTGFAVIASLGLVRILAASDRRDQALDLISTCRRLNRPLALPEPFATRLDMAEARLSVESSTTEAARLIDRLPAALGTSFLRVRLELARGNRQAASELLAQAEQDLTTPRRRLEWQLLDARCGSGTSRESLRTALELAAREGFIRCFLDEGEELVPLLHEQSGAGPTWFVQDVLAAFEASSATTSPSVEGLVDPLSEREKVVLSYLPSWVSSSEIAAELYISLNTLKSHLRSIYRKLGASSRREAVVLARSRGLL